MFIRIVTFIALLLSANVWAEFRHFEMTIEEVDLDVAPGFTYKVWGFNGQVPGPLIHVQEGDDLEIVVQNNTTLSHTVHWHGTYQTGSWRSDGVPDITQLAIEPGDSYTYRFKADKVGSLWYHCHVNVPEHLGIRGMWGPMVVEPKKPKRIEKKVTKEAIVMFSGWNPEVANTYGEGGHPDEPMSYFSINGKSFPMTQPLRVKEGDVVRLRLYAATIPVAFHPHGHDALVTHKDGTPLKNPYPVDVLNMAPGERYDVIIEMNNPGRWIAHDHYEHHVSNNGKAPGGAVLIIEYDDIEDDDWYVWKDKDYQADFYMSESMQLPFGIHDVEAFKGKDPLAGNGRRRRR